LIYWVWINAGVSGFCDTLNISDDVKKMSSPYARYGMVALAATLMFSACTSNPAPPEVVTEPETAAEPATPTEREAIPANVQTYDGTAFNFPVQAQYPDTMQLEDGCGGEGCGFFFTFVPQGNALDTAEVHVFLPAGTATAAEQETFVTGPNGLIENAGWTVDGIEPAADTDFAYPWAEQVIAFSTDQEESGYILLGQTAGQAVQVLLKYPAEMAEDYWPAATIVLDSLTFDAELLPLSPSTEGGVPSDGPAMMCEPAEESC
jgi:hypothetical protein